VNLCSVTVNIFSDRRGWAPGSWRARTRAERLRGREPAAGKGGTRETAAKIGGAGQLAAAAWRPRTKADAETRRLAREGRGRRRRAVTGDLGWAVKRT